MQSPCIGRCDPNAQTCPGCGRSEEEIANWMFYSDGEREAIMQRLKAAGHGRSDVAADNPTGGVFGRKGTAWKLPPINKI
jgi:predicted Fe-S protein YdhL (DUF1289 family)